MAHLYDLVEEAITITSSMTGVDNNNDFDHKDDDKLPLLLTFFPQEFAWPPSNAISIFGADDKVKAGCGQNVSISATDSQSVCKLVAEGQASSASYHDFNTYHLIPSVTHHMNISSDAGDYIYIGSKERGDRMYVSVHDAKFDPSTCIKHAANLLLVIRTGIDTNESLCTFYLVGL